MHNPQLELFSQAGEFQERPRTARPLLENIRAYEKTIFLVMGFLITGAIAFSLGVEKGKKLNAKANAGFDIAAEPAASEKSTAVAVLPRPAAPQAQATNASGAPEIQKAIPKKEPGGWIKKYTIQLASYQTKSYAQKEAETLKKRGLAPVIVTKGKYTVLCVGSFPDKGSAEPLLTKLKKQYQGCFMRRR